MEYVLDKILYLLYTYIKLGLGGLSLIIGIGVIIECVIRERNEFWKDDSFIASIFFIIIPIVWWSGITQIL